MDVALNTKFLAIIIQGNRYYFDSGFFVIVLKISLPFRVKLKLKKRQESL